MRRQPIDPVFTAEPELPVRLCDHPGCEAGGDFPRAQIAARTRPLLLVLSRTRARLQPRLELLSRHERRRDRGGDPARHGLAAAELEARRAAWSRPAHPRCVSDSMPATDTTAAAAATATRRPARDAAARASSAREQALAVFDLEPPLTPVRLKARYKVLVKQHHPDAHGGDKAAEEKLKIINQAYATLKASYFN